MVTTGYTVQVKGDEGSGGRMYPGIAGAVLEETEQLVGGAVRMGFRRSSRIKDRPPSWLKRACAVRFCDMDRKDDCTTRLYFEAPPFGEAAEELYQQGQLFPIHPEPSDTGFDLLGDLLFDVANRIKDSDRFDSALLRRITRLDHPVFGRGVDCIAISGHRLALDHPPKIDPGVITIAKSLDQNTPPPSRSRVQGTLDMMRVSDQTFELVLKDGNRVRAVWTGERFTAMADHLNKAILIEGDAVFRPSGSLLRIDVDALTRATEADLFFSQIPKPKHGDVDRSKYLKPQTPGAGAIFGKWPGDETEEQLLAALKESD